jgi:hypothetical protein
MKRAMVAALLVGLTVQAQTVPTERTLRWVPSLEYTSGGTFDESQIETYPLYCDGQFITEIPNDFTRYYVVSTALLGAGDHECGVSERVDGIESVLSNTVVFPLGQRTPRAPTLTVD